MTSSLTLDDYADTPRMVLVRAQQQADRQGHQWLTPRHVVEQLLASGILHEPLRALGMDAEGLLRTTKAQLAELPSNTGEIATLDNAAQQVLFDAESRSRRAGTPKVATAHLVQALAAVDALPERMLDAEIVDSPRSPSTPPPKSADAYLFDGRVCLRESTRRIQQRSEPVLDGLAVKTLQSIERGLTLIDTLPDLVVEWRGSGQLSLQRRDRSPRLNVTVYRNTILLRVARDDVETVQRFVWDNASVRWADGGRDLFETLGQLLETELYGAASIHSDR